MEEVDDNTNQLFRLPSGNYQTLYRNMKEVVFLSGGTFLNMCAHKNKVKSSKKLVLSAALLFLVIAVLLL